MDAILNVLLTSIVVAAFVAWAAKLLNWVWFRPRKLEKFLRAQGLNGTPFSPFLRDVRDCVSVTTAEQRRSLPIADDIIPHIYPFDMQKISNYGENCFVWFGPWPLWNISDPEIVKDIMKKSDAIQRPYQGAVKILTAGLLTLEGQKWAKHRNIANPAFHLHKLRNMVPAMGLSCRSIINKLETTVNTRSNEGCCEIDIWPYIEYLSGDILSRTVFGSSHEQGRRIFELQKQRIKLLPQVLQFAFIPKWSYAPARVNRETSAIIREVKSILKGMIEKRQAAMERGDDNDLLGILLESNARFMEEEGSKNGGMSLEDVIEECELFYFAGSETTSSLLVWTMVLLCKHQQWQTRAREEVNQVLGIQSHPSFESLNHLKIVTMILQEVMRLYPPIPVIIRRTKEKVKLGKWTIPKGVYLKILIGLLHHDPKIWGDDAKEFKPERFSGGEAKIRSSLSSFMPFAAGPHLCIGQNFAMMEAKIAIAMILRRFSFELAPSYLHAPFSVLSMSPQYGAPMILRSLEKPSTS